MCQTCCACYGAATIGRIGPPGLAPLAVQALASHRVQTKPPGADCERDWESVESAGAQSQAGRDEKIQRSSESRQEQTERQR